MAAFKVIECDWKPLPMEVQQGRIRMVWDKVLDFANPLELHFEDHVFDFRDGARIVVSREKWEGCPEFFHVASTCLYGSKIYQAMADGFVDWDGWQRISIETFESLAEEFDPPEISYIGIDIRNTLWHFSRTDDLLPPVYRTFLRE